VVFGFGDLVLAVSRIFGFSGNFAFRVWYFYFVCFAEMFGIMLLLVVSFWCGFSVASGFWFLVFLEVVWVSGVLVVFDLLCLFLFAGCILLFVWCFCVRLVVFCVDCLVVFRCLC